MTKSFCKEETVKDLHLVSCTYENNSAIVPIEIEGVNVDGKDLDINQEVGCNDEPVTSSQLTGCGYTNKKIYYLKNPIKLSPNEDKTIIIKYTTRVNESDNSCAYRMKYPCKNFSFRFSLDPHTTGGYNLSSHAYGFIDDAKNSAYGTDRGTIHTIFNDWIFTTDGIEVVFSKK